jgi:hypothetical protein
MKVKKGKRKGKKVRGEPGVFRGPYGSLAAVAVREARRRKLFLLIEGPNAAPRWVVYSSTSGRTLLTFWPSTRRWLPAGGDGGTAHDWREVINLSVRLDRQAQERQAQAAGA